MRISNGLLISVVFAIAASLLSGCGGSGGGGGGNKVADLTVASSHSGNFFQGQTGATYTVTAANVGTGATNATVTVVDTLPSALTATDLSGTGWTCTLSSLTCTRNDALTAGSSYPVITLTLDVAANAPASLTNTVTVSGGGESNTANDTANDVATLTCTASLTSLCGQFAFLLDGFDSNGPYHTVGTFTADGFGNLTTGIFDESRSGSTNGPITIQTASSYSVGSDSRGTINLTTAQGNKAFSFVLTTNGQDGDFIESDPATGTHAAGYFVAQQPNPIFQAISLAMGLVGENSSGGRVGLIASFVSDGSCGFNAGNTVTINDAGSVSNNVSFIGTCANGGVSTIDPTTGRAQVSFTFFGGPFNGQTLNFVAYSFSNHNLLILGQDPATSTIPILSGLIRRQLNSATLGCSSGCVFGQWGKTPAGDSDVSIGRFVRQANSTLTRAIDQNQGGIITSNSTTAGFTESISAGGIGTISPPSGSSVPVVDFVVFQNPDAAFFLSRDSSVSFGHVLGQTIPDPGFTPAVPLTYTLNGVFVPTGPPAAAQVGVAEGVIIPSAATAGNFSGTWDAGTGTGFTSTAVSGSFTIDTSTGRGTGTLNIPGDPAGSNPSIVFYGGDLMENDAGNTAARLWFPQ